ncbi:MAG: hypothetical protein RJA44_151 [Pseudomonadota bacterium]
MLQSVQVTRPAPRRVLPLPTSQPATSPAFELADAVAEATQQARLQMASTIGYFGASHECPRAVADMCLATIAQLARLDPTGTLSLRAGSLGGNESLWQEILHCAAAHGVTVQLDAQSPEGVDATLALAEAGLKLHQAIGVTLPGRWLRSRADAERAAALGLRLRIVKGRRPDPQRPQFDEGVGFLGLISRIAGKAAFVSIGTHDAALARSAATRLKNAGTPCELELLLGLPRQGALLVARDLKLPVRVYVPFGEAWTPYTPGHAGRRPPAGW